MARGAQPQITRSLATSSSPVVGRSTFSARIAESTPLYRLTASYRERGETGTLPTAPRISQASREWWWCLSRGLGACWRLAGSHLACGCADARCKRLGGAIGQTPRLLFLRRAL